MRIALRLLALAGLVAVLIAFAETNVDFLYTGF